MSQLIPDKWYFNGKPCKRGGHLTLRQKANRLCGHCVTRGAGRGNANKPKQPPMFWPIVGTWLPPGEISEKAIQQAIAAIGKRAGLIRKYRYAAANARRYNAKAGEVIDLGGTYFRATLPAFYYDPITGLPVPEGFEWLGPYRAS